MASFALNVSRFLFFRSKIIRQKVFLPSIREKTYVSSESCHEDGFFHVFPEKGIRLGRFSPAAQARRAASAAPHLSFQVRHAPHKATMGIGPISGTSVRKAKRFRTNARKDVDEARICASTSASGKLTSADAARGTARHTSYVKRARSGSCAVSSPRSVIVPRESCAVRRNGATKRKKVRHLANLLIIDWRDVRDSNPRPPT